MTKLQEPAAIVIQAETETLAGIKALAKSVDEQFIEQRKAQDKSDLHGLEIGRLICEFAASTEVKAKLAIINKKNKDGGRPQAAHCFVAEQLHHEMESAITARHLERCARAWQKAQKKGLPLGTSLRAAEAQTVIHKITDKPLHEAQPSPERLFEPDVNANEDEPFDPDREAVVIAKKVKTFFFTPTGHPRMKTKNQKEQFISKLNEAFDELDIPCEVVAEGKGE